jgi:hypothetical protein
MFIQTPKRIQQSVAVLLLTWDIMQSRRWAPKETCCFQITNGWGFDDGITPAQDKTEVSR